MKKIRIFLLLSIVVLLSACSAFQPIPKDSVWINPDPYLVQGSDFTLAGLPSYVEEKEVFRISNEMELAALSAIRYREGNLKLNFIAETKPNLDKTFAYLESLLPFSFRLSLGEMTYTRRDNVILTLYSLEIGPVFEDYAEAQTVAQQWVKELTASAQPVKDKIKTFHDQLILRTHYDTSVLDLDLSQITSHPSFEAVGLFTTHTAVCSGYSRAFNALAAEAGIPSLMVSAIGMQHAWNLVYDGSAWVYLDTTFDDPLPDVQNRVRYTYYLLPESAFLADGKHRFDLSGDTTLSAGDYLDFAHYLFPKTVENPVN